MTDVDVVSPVTARLQKLLESVPTGARAAAVAMGAVGAKRARTLLAATSHLAGTATPSLPGQPPSMVSGALHDSVVMLPPVPVGATRFLVEVGGTAIYARIHELGGFSGRGLRTWLPPRPYMRTATQQLIDDGTLTDVAVLTFTTIVWR